MLASKDRVPALVSEEDRDMRRFMNLKILPKILLLLGLLALVSLGATVFSTGKMRYIDDTYGDLIDGPGRANLAIARANRNLVYVNRSIYRLISEITEERIQQAKKEITDTVEFFNNQTNAAIKAMPAEEAEIKRVSGKFAAAMTGACAETIKSASSPGAEEKKAAAALMHEKCDPALNEVMTDISSLTNRILKINDQGSEDALAVTNATIRNTYIFVLGGLGLVIVLVATLIMRGITGPLRQLTDTMTKLANGNHDVEIPGRGRRDEIGAIAGAVEVFKQNAIEKSGFEARDSSQRAMRARQQKDIDQLVGFFGRSISGVFNALSGATANVARTSSTLEASAAATGDQARLMSAEVERTAETVQTVATAAQQLQASINQIGRQAGESSRITSAAMQQADDVVAKVVELRRAAEQIGTVVELIETIAGQTNLLALNATIEASRAGEAGRGFAVVASEVKSLAGQTGNATADIGSQIAAIQAATLAAAEAIQGIADTVRQVNEMATSIASAVVEQGAATQEITRSVTLASSSTTTVAKSVTQVREAVGSNGISAAEAKQTASTLSAEAGTLSAEVKDFLEALQELGGGQGLDSLDLDAAATAIVDGHRIEGRVRKLSPGFVLFAGALTATPGTLLELRIEIIDRPLSARFVEAGDGGVYLQLRLNREHLTYMAGVLGRLGAGALPEGGGAAVPEKGGEVIDTLKQRRVHAAATDMPMQATG
jgi:methyl-accepting chemotaxis protein